MTKLTIKPHYLIFIWCGEYLPRSAHSNDWKPIEIPEPIKLGLFTQTRRNSKNPKPNKAHRLGLKTVFLQPCPSHTFTDHYYYYCYYYLHIVSTLNCTSSCRAVVRLGPSTQRECCRTCQSWCLSSAFQTRALRRPVVAVGRTAVPASLRQRSQQLDNIEQNHQFLQHNLMHPTCHSFGWL